jgi:hypothetical protein
MLVEICILGAGHLDALMLKHLSALAFGFVAGMMLNARNLEFHYQTKEN